MEGGLCCTHEFDVDAIIAVATAFEEASDVLAFAARRYPMLVVLAEKIVELARSGERDPLRLRELALRSMQQ